MQRKKIIFIDKHQFGDLTDVYKWCYYLRDEYDVTVICFDVGLKKSIIDGIKVKYVSSKGSFTIRGIRFYIYCLWNLLLFKGLIVVVYYNHCDWLKRVLFWKKMMLDIRTLSVDPKPEVRKKYDNAIKNACGHYDKVSIISDGIKNKIGEAGKKAAILPLGADCISRNPKDYSAIRLIYVGTFNGRDLDKTIKGTALFCERHPEVDLTYDIVGSGSGNELMEYKKMSLRLGLHDKVFFHGKIANHALGPYFEKANIGVSFVPITDYYNHQPPTKTFEYVLSGLFVIATATYEHKHIITPENGVLIQDTEKDFAQALEFIWQNRLLFNETKIRTSLSDYLWTNIVDKKLKPVLENLTIL